MLRINQRLLVRSLRDAQYQYLKSTALRFLSSSTQSNVETTPRRSGRLFELNKEYTGKLAQPDGKANIESLYSEFKNDLDKISEFSNGRQGMAPKYGRSRSLSFINRLFQSITNAKNTSSLDPYVVLEQLSKYNLIGPAQYEMILKYYLLVKDAPKDVISLWVKYLEQFTTSNENLMAYTTIAYLKLPDMNEPDCSMLQQILQTERFHTDIPFGRIISIVEQNEVLKRDQQLSNRFAYLLNLYATQNKTWFINQLDICYTESRLRSFYNIYSAQRDINNCDIEIITKFMEQFNKLNANSSFPMQVFNEYKDKLNDADGFKLKLGLLDIVSKYPAPSKIQKLQRLLAVWNSYLKPEFGKVGIDASLAYASLIKALNTSGNIEELQNIWEKEIPTEYKNNQVVFEAFLLAIIRRTKITYSQIQNRIDATKFGKLKSVDLAEAIALKIFNENPNDSKVFDDFYQQNSLDSFGSNTSILALKTYGDYIYKTKTDDETYVIANDVRSKVLKLKPQISTQSWKQEVNLILEKFIDIAPSIIPVRVLFEQRGIYQLNFTLQKKILFSEFRKPDGDVQNAEKIFEELMKTDNNKVSQPMRINSPQLMGTMIKGLCQVIGRTHDVSLYPELSKYLEMLPGLEVHMSINWMEQVLRTIRMVFRSGSTKTIPKELLEFSEFIIEKLPAIDPDFNYQFRNDDIAMFKKIGAKSFSKLKSTST
ncbi:Meiotic sister-chromatid recombination protein 6, mitochondrial [Nakaseomyces glabratus]|nr:Meiotic sister-chromatid recombination protein 6, mitochondrial [Nakaseomyces glabratus]KTB26831.1 Meiotic sister-chromatid recombination protein 6, mitochondrial [Nakaseomyces glabratus]